MGALGLLRVRSNADIARAQHNLSSRAEIRQEDAPITALGGHISRFWQAAQTAKITIERQMLKALRQRNGVYEPDKLALIRDSSGGSEIYMMLTSAKCRGVESWLREILLPDVDPPWGMEPTPMADLPPPVRQAIIDSVIQEAMQAGWEIDDSRIDDRLLKLKAMAASRIKEIAAKIAERHQLKISDQFAEGGWEQAMSDCIYDLVTFPAAIMKGPFLRMRTTLKWAPQPDGQWMPVPKRCPSLEYQRRSPLDIFPAPAMRNLQNGNLIDRYRLSRSDFQDLRGLPGYSEDAIDEVLKQYGDRGYSSRSGWETERAILELRPNEQFDPEQSIEALNFWGSVSGKMLNEWGVHYGQDLGGRIKENREYQIEAWKVGRYIIKAMLNPDPLGRKPYDKACFEEIPDSVWGKGVPDLMGDCADMCNNAARSIANNAAMASGPMVDVAVDRMADGEKVTRPYPWRVFQTVNDMTGTNQPAIRFFQPQMNVQELLLIYNHFSAEADNVTGFPKYSYGDSKVGGAGRTSSGLAQLLGTVGKGARRVVSAFTRGIVCPKVQSTFEFNMQFDEDPTIKGDLRVVPKGVAATLMKDQAQMRRKEILQATTNPLDAQIMGIKGRTELLREVIKGADFDATKILPDGLDLELAAANSPPPYEIMGGASPSGGSVSAPGGTPSADPNLDAGGMPVNGTRQREINQGYADGGVIRRRRFRLERGEDDEVLAEEVEVDE